MSNGNGSNFYADVRMKLMNLRIEHNKDYDDFSKWVDESEQQMLAKNKGKSITPPLAADDKVIEASVAVPSLISKPDRE